MLLVSYSHTHAVEPYIEGTGQKISRINKAPIATVAMVSPDLNWTARGSILGKIFTM